MEFSEKLINLRRREGMSQEQLADRLGVTRQSVSKWESGAVMPELVKLIALSEMFGVSVDYLVKDWLEEPAEEDWETASARLEQKVDDLTRSINGHIYRYDSKTRILGLPLVSVRIGFVRRHRMSRDDVARGVIAIGNAAIGVVSLGIISIGLISFGAIAVGLLALGIVSLGLGAFGVAALGYLAFGVSAIGVYAGGVCAAGTDIAVGVAAASANTAVGCDARRAPCASVGRRPEQGGSRGFSAGTPPRSLETAAALPGSSRREPSIEQTARIPLYGECVLRHIERLLVQDFPPDEVKGGVLALVPQLEEDGLQQGGGVGMDQQPLVLAPQKKLVGVAGVEIRAPVYLAGGQPVAEHFSHVFFRHLHADDALAVGAVIGPEFKMVPVAALVVHPGGAVAEFLPLGVVGAVVTLEVLHARPEFHRGVFGQVVGQPLPVQAQTKAVFPHQRPVAVHGFQMAPEVQGASPRIKRSQNGIGGA